MQLQVDTSGHYLSKLFSMLKYQFQISNWYTIDKNGMQWDYSDHVVLTQDQLSHKVGKDHMS